MGAMSESYDDLYERHEKFTMTLWELVPEWYKNLRCEDMTDEDLNIENELVKWMGYLRNPYMGI